MLSTLRIENLAVIPGAEIAFAPGLNIISGETGSGKTILAQAIALLLGCRADNSLIRPDAGEASVEAIFNPPDGFFHDLADELDIVDGEELAVRRRLARDGRSRAYLGGRIVNLSVLEQVTGRLLAFSAQHEQRRLMMASHQLEILDAYCGEEMLDLKDEFRILYDRRAAIIGTLEELNRGSEMRQREAELLRFQVEEIEAAALDSGEEADLEERRLKLSRARELNEVSLSLATELGAADADASSVMDSLADLITRLETLSGVDQALDDIAARMKRVFFELEDLGGAARDYSGIIMPEPQLLAEIEDRLDLISQLKRKYGDSVENVIDYFREASRRLSLMGDTAAGREQLELELADIDVDMVRLAEDMRRLRGREAPRLAAAAVRHMEDLAFDNCGLDLRLVKLEGEERGGPEPSSMSPDGADAVEFFVSLNPGMPANALRDTASGGELSRVMLAVKCAVSETGGAQTLVFDEIDAGIGGETGAAVGAKLKHLAQGSQILCITHLPQIACYADANLSVVKGVDEETGETVTEVLGLSGDGIVDELCRMMGSRPDNSEARAHAGSLIRKASLR